MAEARDSGFRGSRRWFMTKVYVTCNEVKWVKRALSEELGELGLDKRMSVLVDRNGFYDH